MYNIVLCSLRLLVLQALKMKLQKQGQTLSESNPLIFHFNNKAQPSIKLVSLAKDDIAFRLNPAGGEVNYILFYYIANLHNTSILNH